MTIELRAPSGLRAKTGSIWYGTGFMELDVDRIDFTVNNDVKVYMHIDEETQLNQLFGSKIQAYITGHLTSDSNFMGVNLATKAKNLILAGRQWYYGIRATSTEFPQFKWNDTTYQFLFQKIMTIDTPDIGDEIINYQLGIIIQHGGV